MGCDIVSYAVTTGFGVTVLTGIISGVCYLLAQGINKKRGSRPGQEWHCTNCGTYLRSIEGILEGEKIITCEKCETHVCKNKCSSRHPTQGWICNICSKTPLSWYESVLKVIQPSKVSVNMSTMDQDSLRQFETDLEEMRNKEKAEVRDFIERLVNAMLGDDVDDACVTRLYKDKKYLPEAGQSPCTAHTALKQLIQRLLRDSNELPTLPKEPNNTEVPSEENNSTYEDLLATAIINKVISSCQNNQNLPSSSANSVSSRQSTSSRTKDEREYFFGEETLDSKWKTTDLDTTSISSLEDWMQNENGTNKYVDKVSLTIKQNIEELPHTDSDDDQDDSEYFKNKSLLSDDDANWFLQKRQFQGTHSPVPVPMLVPDPTGDAKVLIGDKELDETSDLSDIDADFGDTEAVPEVKSLLVNSKTIIGGKNILEHVSMGSDGELSADSGVRDDTKDFDDFGSTSNLEEPIIYAEAVNPSKTDITVDDDNVEDVSITSSYSNTEKDTEYTEKYASLPRTIEKSASMSKYDRELRKRAIENEAAQNVQNIQEDENESFPSIEVIGNYTKKEREKWKHAVQMKNNPYSKENIEKRLSRSNSSTSSLFGKDYYIKQSSQPCGSKVDNENPLPKWPRNIDDEEKEEIYTAKPAIVQEDDDEEPITPKIIPDREASFSEITSDSDISYNMYDVAKSEIYTISRESVKNKINKFNDYESLDRAQNKKPYRRTLSECHVSPNNGSVELDSLELISIEESVENFKESTSEFLNHEKKHLFFDNAKKVYPRTRTVNRPPLARWVSNPNISTFDMPSTVIKRKKDNTLISKIYMDPNVRKEALSKREFIPDEVDSPNEVPTFGKQSFSDISISPVQTPEKNRTILASTSTPSERKKPVQSLGFKVEENDSFEVQEAQTDILYSSGDSEEFNKVLNHFNSLESSESKNKKIDPVLGEINQQHLVAERLGKFSKSMPDFGNEKSDPRTNFHNNLLSEEFRISVKELKKRFERDDEPKNFIANSLTARTLGRGTINNLKFT